ncbi:MAG: hypothetical protein ACYC8T_07335 [Myxococcaceae bacterium]
MKNLFVLATSLIALSLTACAGSSAATAPAPTAKLELAPPTTGNSLVVIYRNVGGFMGGAAMFNVTLQSDSKAVGDIAHDTYVVLEVKPGEHLITAKGPAGSESNLPLTVGQDVVEFVQVDMSAGNTPALKSRLAAEAKGELVQDNLQLGFRRSLVASATP